MEIQTELKTVTAEIAARRSALAEVEKARVMQRHELTQAEARLAAARVVLMARSDAGTNDAARRAYAERELVDDRDEIERLGYNLAYTEIAVIENTAELRIAEDRRRYLETVVRLMVDRAADLLQYTYGGNSDSQPSSVQPATDENGTDRVSFIDWYAPEQEP